MMNEPFRIIIICEDLILNALLKKAFKLWIENASVVVCNSFSGVKSISPDITTDLIILDDFITGTASHEILHILRQKKKIKCPVYYLSNVEYWEEKKVLYQGAHYFFKKPFDPEHLMKHISEKTKARALA
ncbi:MAG: response regulator transcription factor [Bacteroidales bacterium]|nr:response regulator transcription factor [Bacteroidales bacterium]